MLDMTRRPDWPTPQAVKPPSPLPLGMTAREACARGVELPDDISAGMVLVESDPAFRTWTWAPPELAYLWDNAS